MYRASWNGTTVAVKVIETTESLGEGEGVAPGASGCRARCLQGVEGEPPCRAVLAPLPCRLPSVDACPPCEAQLAWHLSAAATRHEGPHFSAGKSGIFEAVLSSNLSHPNIVHTYQYAFRPVSVRAPFFSLVCQLAV